MQHGSDSQSWRVHQGLLSTGWAGWGWAAGKRRENEETRERKGEEELRTCIRSLQSLQLGWGKCKRSPCYADHSVTGKQIGYVCTRHGKQIVECGGGAKAQI